MSLTGESHISRNSSVVQQVPPGHLIGIEYIFNPYTQKYQQVQDGTKKKPFVQTVLRTTATDSSFWIGDTLTEQPKHSDTRFILHNYNGVFGDRDSNFIKSKFSNYVNNHAHFLALHSKRDLYNYCINIVSK